MFTCVDLTELREEISKRDACQAAAAEGDGEDYATVMCSLKGDLVRTLYYLYKETNSKGRAR